MVTQPYNIIAEQNATEPLVVWYKDPDGNAINLSGYNAKMDIRSKKSVDSHLYLRLTSDPNGGIVITPAEGRLDIVITDEQTAQFDFSAAFYDVLIEAPNGTRTRLVEGKIINSRGSTA